MEKNDHQVQQINMVMMESQEDQDIIDADTKNEKNATGNNNNNLQSIPLILIESIPDELAFAISELSIKCPLNNIRWLDFNPQENNTNQQEQQQVDEDQVLRDANIVEFPHHQHNLNIRNQTINRNKPLETYQLKCTVTFIKDVEMPPGQYHVTSASVLLDQDLDEIDYVHLKNRYAKGYIIQIQIHYHRITEAMRALGRTMSLILISDQEKDYHFKEDAQFDNLGIMIDCSRNAVLTVDSVQFMIRNLALMGFNTLKLYTEDTYEIDHQYPMFGYFRGRFSQAELKAIDDYAFHFGIEVIPCIQTLGHMGQILQWPQFTEYRDTSEVLLVDSNETLELIQNMIISISSCFRSKRIHIGMDEANSLGEGRYKLIHGPQDGLKLFINHLKKVVDVCHWLNLKPMIWSDMLFTLSKNTNSLEGYYEMNNDLPTEVTSDIPPDVDLVYWNYYYTCPKVYSKKIQEHRKLGFDPWVAGGIWTWNRLYSALPFTFKASTACIQACKSQNVRNVFVTIWGDDGNECDLLSALPALMLYGEYGYTSENHVDHSRLQQGFHGICGGSLDNWLFASKIDIPKVIEDIPVSPKAQFPSNMAKWLLWQDVFYSILDPQHISHQTRDHYDTIVNYLQENAFTPEHLHCYPFDSRLEFPYLIAQVLTLKCNLRELLVHAYFQQDKVALKTLVDTNLLELIEKVDKLWMHHRDQIWLSTYKPFGLEVIELRYGGLRTRLQSLKNRLTDYVNDIIPSIPEFQVLQYPIFPHAGPALLIDFARAYTPSRNLGTG